jgi:hypothetical protein
VTAETTERTAHVDLLRHTRTPYPNPVNERQADPDE